MTLSGSSSGRVSPWQRLRGSRLLHYGLAMVGPFGGAVTQFVLSVQMLHALPTASFGTFAFLLVLFQFGTGLSSALFCTPLPIILHDDGGRGVLARAVLTANLAYCLAAALLFMALGMGLGLSGPAAGLFAAYVGAALMRWFARAFAYATGAARRTMASDVVYSTTLFICIAGLWFKGADSVADPAAALLIGAAAALLPFGVDYLRRQFSACRVSDLPNYRPVWRTHGRWSLLGVVTMEATANAHAYLVTLLAGPLAFAPLAATALLIRPMGVIMNTLGEFERPRLARAIARGAEPREVRGTVRIAWMVLAVAWLGTAGVAAALLIYAPHLVFPAHYQHSDLVAGVSLWLAVAAARCWRAPESTLLQATGRFKGLAYASLVSCWVSLVSVAAVLWFAGPIASLLGVLAGEIIFAIWVAREARRWNPKRGPVGTESAA